MGAICSFFFFCFYPAPFFFWLASRTCILASFYQVSLTASDLCHKHGMWQPQVSSAFHSWQSMLSLDFLPLKRGKNKHMFWLISLPFLQLQIKLTSWLDSGRGDLLFSQIIFVSFLPMYSLPVISSMYAFDSWNCFYCTCQSVLLIAKIFFSLPRFN